MQSRWLHVCVCHGSVLSNPSPTPLHPFTGLPENGGKIHTLNLAYACLRFLAWKSVGPGTPSLFCQLLNSVYMLNPVLLHTPYNVMWNSKLNCDTCKVPLWVLCKEERGCYCLINAHHDFNSKTDLFIVRISSVIAFIDSKLNNDGWHCLGLAVWGWSTWCHACGLGRCSCSATPYGGNAP